MDKPGVYFDVPFDDYLNAPYVNKSAITAGLRSMAHMKQSIEDHVEPTKAMRFGTLVHAGKLEPLAVAQRYAVMPAYELDDQNQTAKGVCTQSKNTRYYRDKVAAFTAANVGKEIVTQDEFDRMLGMMSALASHPIASSYLDCPGKTEVSLVWDDADTGLRCKARVDKFDSTGCRIPDLKTTADASDFERSIARFRYDIQGAFYLDGIKALTSADYEFPLVAIETTPPYGVRAAPLAESAIEHGRNCYRRVLRQYAAWQSSGRDPQGYASPAAWELPEWFDTGSGYESLLIGGEPIMSL